MKEHFITLYHYETWANEAVMDSIVKHAPNDQQILRLFSHILSAQTIWLQRMSQQPTLQSAWQVLAVEECKLQMQQNHQLLWDFLSNIQDIHQKIFYKNTKGEEFCNSIYEILTHLFNHSSYHRGQIVFCLKNYTQDLPVTDIIFYLRKDAQKA
ncbi:MAG: hypothetical protein KatS3mg035_0851 [Bacteroidia bacterium]|nr:MAG: hypothetical protein KatS3mg035_0851 [Bacteroidia bacterium]